MQVVTLTRLWAYDCCDYNALIAIFNGVPSVDELKRYVSASLAECETIISDIGYTAEVVDVSGDLDSLGYRLEHDTVRQVNIEKKPMTNTEVGQSLIG